MVVSVSELGRVKVLSSAFLSHGTKRTFKHGFEQYIALAETHLLYERGNINDKIVS